MIAAIVAARNAIITAVVDPLLLCVIAPRDCGELRGLCLPLQQGAAHARPEPCNVLRERVRLLHARREGEVGRR